MLRNTFRLEHKIGENLIYVSGDQSTSVDQLKEALFQFSKYLGQIEDNIKAQEAAKAAAEQPAVEPEVAPVVAQDAPVEDPVEPVQE